MLFHYRRNEERKYCQSMIFIIKIKYKINIYMLLIDYVKINVSQYVFLIILSYRIELLNQYR